MNYFGTTDTGTALRRLDDIAGEFRDLGPKYERAVREAITVEYDYRKAEAGAFVVAEGKNADERKAHAVLSLVESGWFEKRKLSEANRRGIEALLKVRESEKSALQTKLKVEIVELGGG